MSLKSPPAAKPSAARRDLPDLPRLPTRLLPRVRLIERLNAWTPITVLRGPAGTGKSTLIAAWLSAQSSTEVSWWWPDDLAELDLDNAVRELLADRRKVVIVLDGPAGDPAQLLPQFVALVQRHRDLHLVVCTHGRHVLETIAAALPGVSTIGPSELMFTVDEVAELAPSLPAAAVEEIHAMTGGWPAIVRLVLDADDGLGRALPLGSVTHYVQSMVLTDSESVAASTDLLYYSLAEYLDVEVIRAMCGTDEARRVIARLEASGFVERCDKASASGKTTVFEYAPLVRDALRAACIDRDPSAARLTHARLAGWFAQRSGPQYALPALRHAMAAREWTLVGQLWDRRGLGLIAAHPGRVRVLLRDIPVEVANEHPSMRIFAAVAARLSEAAPDLDVVLEHQAGAALRLTAEQLLAMPLADLLYLASVKLIASRVSSSGVTMERDEIDALSDRVSTQFATSAEAAALGERVAWFDLQIGLTMALAGQRDEAIRRYQLAIDRANEAGAWFVVARAAALLALTYAIGGYPDLAHRWITARDEVTATGRCGPRDGEVAARIAVGLLALDRLDEAAVGSSLGSLDGVSLRHELWPYLAYLRGGYALHYGEPATMLTKLAALTRANAGPAGGLVGLAAELLGRARADLLMALSQGQRAQAAITDAGVKLPVAAARLSMQSGDYARARLWVARVVYSEAIEPRDQLELFVIDAVAAVRAGDPEGARESFRKALACSAGTANVRVFATIPQSELAVLGELAGAEPELPPNSRTPVYGSSLVLISLTKSEIQLLEALERTGSRREIAETRFVSLNTVKTQMRALYQKLGTTNRDDTLARVRELGLLA
jgi:LuxR family maltose regulon positive regulatory protein